MRLQYLLYSLREKLYADIRFDPDSFGELARAGISTGRFAWIAGSADGLDAFGDDDPSEECYDWAFPGSRWHE